MHGARRTWRVPGFQVLESCLVAILVAACGGEVAEAPGSIHVEPLPTIGGDVEGGPGAFGQVGDIEMDGRGDVYVLDRMAGSIQVFDEAGDYLRSIGRSGEGPGELQSPTAIGWGPRGNLWVVDPRNARYSVFDTAGNLVATHRRSLAGIAGEWPVTFTPEGRLYDVTFDLGPGGPSAVPVELDVGGEEVKEMGRVELPPLGPWGLTGTTVEQDGHLVLMEVPFSPVQVWQIGPGGDLWYANTGIYEIRRRSADGTETLFSRDVVAPAVTDSERQAALEENELLKPSMIPETKPPLRGFFVGEQGDLWVLLRSASGKEADRVDVFDSDGHYAATLDLALDPQPRPKVRAGIVLGVATNELGVQRVVRYRIEGRPGAVSDSPR